MISTHEFPAVKCLDCGEFCPASFPLVDEAHRPVGHLCESCYTDTVETEESLRARGDYL